ncbi:MAG: hypothetical protein JW902_15265, partial [Syntrophaceae bacterium]|nr:hypothetical protein [Syntrophaceae bacterium]
MQNISQQYGQHGATLCKGGLGVKEIFLDVMSLKGKCDVSPNKINESNAYDRVENEVKLDRVLFKV